MEVLGLGEQERSNPALRLLSLSWVVEGAGAVCTGHITMELSRYKDFSRSLHQCFFYFAEVLSMPSRAPPFVHLIKHLTLCCARMQVLLVE